jgi:hypothetical protein
VGLFRRLLGSREEPSPTSVTADQRPPWMTDGMAVTISEGREELLVVGESFYQDALWRLVGGGSHYDEIRVDLMAMLVADEDNQYDANAVSVWVNGLKVGHLSRGDAKRLRPGLIALQQRHGMPIAVRGVIAGGGQRPDGPGRLGVFLRYDPRDFGLRASKSPTPREARMDTGLSDALATDDADTSYDLAWMARLPEDSIGAIRTLRNLLESEEDPLDRHFMFHHLETALYRSRDAFASALDEFDECCRLHDAEMEAICEAFLSKWEKVPTLQTYKQMCIRLAKAKDFQAALWWAERGLALYGDRAAREDAVADLQKRADSYRLRLKSERGSSLYSEGEQA